MLQRVPADPCEICSLCAGWMSDGAAVVLDKSSQVASGLDQIDAEAEDVRLDGEGEAKIGAFPGDLSRDLVQGSVTLACVRHGRGDGFQRLVEFC